MTETPDASATDRRVTVVCLSLLLAGTVLGIVVPAGPGWDFANFYDTGARVVAGRLGDIYDPSTPIRGQSPQGSMAFWGAPASAFFYAPMALLAPGTALVVFKIQNTLAYFLALLLLYLHLRRFAGDSRQAQVRFGALFAFLSLIYQPFWTIYRVGGQTTPTIFLLLTLGLLMHTAGKTVWTVISLVLAVLIKPAFLPVLGILALISGTRFLGTAAVVGAAVAGASVAVLGWPIHQEFLAVLARGATRSYPWVYNSSLYVWLDALRIPFPPRLGQGPGGVVAGAVVVAKLLVLGFAIVMFLPGQTRAWTPRARRHFHFLLAVAFCLLLSQTVWEHYLAALFLPLAYMVAMRERLGRAAVALISVIFFLAIWQNLIIVNVIRNHVRWDSFVILLAAGLLKSGPLLVFLLVLVRHRAAVLATYTSPAWTSGAAR
jgi:glycosyl transferase family 87